MTREEAVIILDGFKNNPLFNDTHLQAFNMAISALSDYKKMQEISLDLAFENDELINKSRWIPVKYHEITDEERAREGYPREWSYLIDCKMPYDGQQILTTTKGGFVELDECYYDGCAYSLDSDRDWVDDVIAWMPLPKPYKADMRGE